MGSYISLLGMHSFYILPTPCQMNRTSHLSPQTIPLHGQDHTCPFLAHLSLLRLSLQLCGFWFLSRVPPTSTHPHPPPPPRGGGGGGAPGAGRRRAAPTHTFTAAATTATAPITHLPLHHPQGTICCSFLRSLVFGMCLLSAALGART